MQLSARFDLVLKEGVLCLWQGVGITFFLNGCLVPGTTLTPATGSER